MQATLATRSDGGSGRAPLKAAVQDSLLARRFWMTDTRLPSELTELHVDEEFSGSTRAPTGR